MDSERFSAMKAEFDALRDRLKETTETCERIAIMEKLSALLHQAQEIQGCLVDDLLRRETIER